MPYIRDVTWACWDGLAAFLPRNLVILAGFGAGLSLFCIPPLLLLVYAIFVACVDLVQKRSTGIISRIFMVNMEGIASYFQRLWPGLVIFGGVGILFAVLRRRTLLTKKYPKLFGLSFTTEGLVATLSGYLIYYLFATLMEVPGLLTQGVWLFIFSGPALNLYLQIVHSLFLVLLAGRAWQFTSQATAKMLLWQKLGLDADRINSISVDGRQRMIEVDALLDATDLRRAEDLLLGLPHIAKTRVTSPLVDPREFHVQSGESWRSLAESRQAR